MSTPMVRVRDLEVTFGSVRVLHGMSMDVERGETVGVVGESGSGKSTLAKVLVGMVQPSAGDVVVGGTDVGRLGRRRRDTFPYRRRVQLIPQDPYSSLSPRRTVGQTLAEAADPLRADVAGNLPAIHRWLERVGLEADMASRFPHEFSGGQRQRIAIARCLITSPELVIADEITSALDVSVQAQILDLLADIRSELHLTMVFISHNLAVVQRVSDHVVVMNHGHVVEAGTVEQVYGGPRHPYTRRLLDADPGAPGFSLQTVKP
ncbi:ABC transporter ATP-binding protein [Kineococcus arenarius]|uniref:ABC transporter ATP-binding protein n=1 Tax=unclassified Kineococcus TaxID=2621656 RepID=UPI003D7D8DCD